MKYEASKLAARRSPLGEAECNLATKTCVQCITDNDKCGNDCGYKFTGVNGAAWGCPDTNNIDPHFAKTCNADTYTCVDGCHPAALLDSTSLLVSAVVHPSIGSAPRDSIVTVTVSVTNPENRQVVVHLGGPPYKTGVIPAAETNGAGFGMRVLAGDSAGPRGPTEWTWGQSDYTFGPRETLTHEFTLRLRASGPDDKPLKPGRYSILASFGHKEAQIISLAVQP